MLEVFLNRRGRSRLAPFLLVLLPLFFGRASMAGQPTWPPETVFRGESTALDSTVILSPQAAEAGRPVDVDACRAYPQAGLFALTPVPCATPTRLTSAKADRVWMEVPGWITPGSFPVGCPASRSPCTFSFPLIPAGKLRLLGPPYESEDLGIRLVGVSGVGPEEEPGLEVVRALSVAEGQKGAQMPEGTVLPLLLRSESREILALGKPVETTAELEKTFRLEEPAQTDLLVILRKPEVEGARSGGDLQLRLLGDWLEGKAPDHVFSASERYYAVWYDLPGSRAALELSSNEVFLPRQHLVLRPRAVEMLQADLRPLPKLQISLDLPEALRRKDLALRIERLPGWVLERRVELRRDADSAILEGLPATTLEVVLESDPWRFREAVDLSDGKDGESVFSPRPILLTGTVYRGDRGHPAKIRLRTEFSSADSELRLETDPAGTYEATLFRPGPYVALVELEGSSGPPLIEYFEVPNGSAHERDFGVLDASFAIRVIDAETGEGIGSASVLPMQKRSSGEKSGYPTKTDAEGNAELTHLQEGELTFNIHAEGYEPYDSGTIEVTAKTRDREVTVALEQEGETLEVQISLPAGLAAAEAEAILLSSLRGPAGALWKGSADSGGRLRVPRRYGGTYLLVRHPQAASAFRRWSPESEPANPIPWRLAEAAESPLRIVARNPRSEEPAPFAPLTLWIAQEPLRGLALRWLTYSSFETTDGSGYWSGRQLPRADLRVLAWSSKLRSQEMAGALDSLATPVGYPWQALEVELIE